MCIGTVVISLVYNLTSLERKLNQSQVTQTQQLILPSADLLTIMPTGVVLSLSHLRLVKFFSELAQLQTGA